MNARDCKSARSRFACDSVPGFHFFLYVDNEKTSNPEWSLTKTLNELENKLIEKGTVAYRRLAGLAAKVSVKMHAPCPVGEIASFLSDTFKQTASLELPLYLFSEKARIADAVSKIAAKHEAAMHLSTRDKKIVVHISGTARQCNRARIDAIAALERILGNDPKLISDIILAVPMINSGQRVYFQSKIFCRKALVSGAERAQAADEESLICARARTKPDADARCEAVAEVISSIMAIEKIKMSYCLCYMRDKLESVLCRTECYIEGVRESQAHSVLTLASKCRKKLALGKAELAVFFSTIVKARLRVNHSDHWCSRVFVLEVDEAKPVLLDHKRIIKRYNQGPCSTVVFVGESSEVKRILRENDAECELQMELDGAIEEFLCGKKNGKINKVSREGLCSVSIVKDADASSMLVVIEGSSRNVEFSLSMIEDELPAEYSFFLDEKHHKRIIGYGGKNIQRIMKKHGVYIKFESGSIKEENVIIRTPRKNRDSLSKMYKDVMEMAGETPFLVLGSWSFLSIFEFYTFRFPVFRLECNGVAVYSLDKLDIRYYMVEKKRCEGLFVAAANTYAWASPLQEVPVEGFHAKGEAPPRDAVVVLETPEYFVIANKEAISGADQVSALQWRSEGGQFFHSYDLLSEYEKPFYTGLSYPRERCDWAISQRIGGFCRSWKRISLGYKASGFFDS